MNGKIIFFFLAVIFLSACSPVFTPSDTETTFATPDPKIELAREYVFSNGGWAVTQACEIKWPQELIATSYSWDIEGNNPYLVTVVIRPIPMFDGYIVNFNSDDTANIYRDGVEVLGEENEIILAKAVDLFDGVTRKEITFEVAVSNNVVTSKNYDCGTD